MPLCFRLQVIWEEVPNMVDSFHLKVEAESVSEKFPPLKIKTMNKVRNNKKNTVSFSHVPQSEVYSAV